MVAMSLAPGLSRKLKKVLDTETENPDIVTSLETLSTFYSENTPHSRRNLKSTIEKRALQINEDFLNASQAAQQALDRVEEEVNSLVDCCEKISKALNSCHAVTEDVISTTERLKHELEVTKQKQDTISCFLRDYQLSGEEIHALREEDLSEGFFKALSRVQEIHANCKTLLRTHHQRAGLELMDMMAAYQEGAYERICRWLLAECKKLGDTDNPEVGEILRSAIRCLKERPVLFKYCAEEVANIRHNALFRRFISALTRGGPGGLPRPIEVHAHDPLRYVGDMLGWLHQALASEKEFVLMLLDPDSSYDTGSNGVDRASSEFQFVLDRIFEGVCRPFKARVEQVLLQSQLNLVIAFKLSNTLEFYNHTVLELLGRSTSLCSTMETLRDVSQRTFFDILKRHGEKLVNQVPVAVAADLSPPQAVKEGVSILLEIMETCDNVMIRSSGGKLEIEHLISALLDPLVQMCEKAAEEHRSKVAGRSRRRSSDSGKPNKSSIDALLPSQHTSTFFPQDGESRSRIFLLNCLSAIRQPLVNHHTASGYIDKLGAAIDAHLRSLIDQEASSILARCGLWEKMPLFRDDPDADRLPMAEAVETSPAALSGCLKMFFGFILGSEPSLPEFELLQDPKLRSNASLRVAVSLAEAYECIYKAIMDRANGYPDPKSLARHPPDQIRTILGI